MKLKSSAVSSCFLIPSRYNGERINYSSVTHFLNKLKAHGVAIIPFCPEQLGGLTTPRTAAEMRGKNIVTQTGEDVTQAFLKGAEITLELLKNLDVSVALVKQRSPSCGFGKIYDGTFSGTLIAGEGVSSGLLYRNGITLYTEDDLEAPYFIEQWCELYLSDTH